MAIKYFFKINAPIVGNIKKINTSLHPQNKNMLRLQAHIETENRFSPKRDYTSCGACYAAE